MQPDAPFASNLEPAKGLPSVVPPSGKFIAQLFLVPFVIVTVVVGFLLLVNWLVGGVRTPEDFLRKLDDPNPDVRWRGAQDLAQVLLRDDQLAANPKFALDLADRLGQALRASSAEEKALAERPPTQSKSELETQDKALDPGRDHILYLSACLGNVSLPVGAPLLSQMALSQPGGNAKAIARRRWRAVWALANLGESLKRLDVLSEARLEAVAAELEEEAGSSERERADWARRALNYLKNGQERSLHSLGVDKALLSCAEDADPFLREIAAFALNFWEGSPTEEGRIEQRLLRLTYDDGHGEEIVTRLREGEEKAPEAITRLPGLKIRYNAAVALARRGSDKVRPGLLQEMLDESIQRENFRLKLKDGQEMADDATASLTLVTALRATAELHRRRPERDLSALYPALDKLAQSSNGAIRTEVERTLSELGRK